jgi:hypothetical protein
VPDFYVANHGSIFLLTPVTQAAREWVAEHIPEDAPALGHSIAIEHRFVGEVLAGITEDGLKL